MKLRVDPIQDFHFDPGTIAVYDRAAPGRDESAQ